MIALRVLRIAVVVVCLGGVGCAMSPPPADAFYRLEARSGPGAGGEPVLPGILEVGTFRADPLTGGRAMVFRVDDGSVEVRRHAYSYWVDAPANMLQLELAGYLRDAGVASLVITPGMRVIADNSLSGTVRRLERIQGPTPHVLVELEFTLVNRESRALELQKSYRGEISASSDSVESAVEAYSRALDSIFVRLVDDLRKTRTADRNR